MIPVKDDLIDIDNLPGEEIAFGIGDPRWVMKTQASMYSDITTAIIREYSTNAYDSHVMAGNPDPIRVTLPSPFSPHYIVEDSGVGMDLDTLRNVYTQFGVSNKRGSVDTNGMLGYGSKSGVAYTTQFSVTSIKDGIKTFGVIRRKPDWEITLKVVSRVKTSEPNGTRIEIPVHNVEEFNHKANEFFKFWLPGRVLINGVAPEHRVGEKISEGLYHALDWNTSYIVMGNVAYRIANPTALFRGTSLNQINFVAYAETVDDGTGAVAAVEFTPSREDLMYTDHTKNTLYKIVEGFEEKVRARAKEDISGAEDHPAAYAAWSKWRLTAGESLLGDLEYKGDKLESRFKIDGTVWNVQGYSHSTGKQQYFQVHMATNALFVTEFDILVSSSAKSRVRKYIAQAGLQGIRYVVFLAGKSDDIDCKWISRDNFITWQELKDALPKKPKAPKSPRVASGRIRGSFDIQTTAGFHEGVDLDTVKGDLVWVPVRGEGAYEITDIRKVLSALESEVTVVFVPKNRLDKFKRDVPEAIGFKDFIKANLILDKDKVITDAVIDVSSIGSLSARWYSVLDPKRVDDPEVKRAIGLYKSRDEVLKKYLCNKMLGDMVGERVPTVELSADVDATQLVARYPLLAKFRNWETVASEHLYLYINAAYAAEKEKK